MSEKTTEKVKENKIEPKLNAVKTRVKSTTKKATEAPKEKDKAEVVFAVVNTGYEQKIVEVCNRLNIGGGTFLNASGMSKYDADKFFNVVVEKEKSIVMLVVDAKKRNALLKELYESVGPASDAKGIVFALPVDEVSYNLKEQIFSKEKPEEE